MSHWRVPMAPRCTGSPPSLLAYAATIESLWTSRPTYSVLSFFIADLRSHGQCQRALCGSDLAEANPRVETEVSLSPRQSLCLEGQDAVKIKIGDAGRRRETCLTATSATRRRTRRLRDPSRPTSVL